MGCKTPPDGRKLNTSKKTRRSIKYKKDINREKENLIVIGINCNGLSGKRDSLSANLEILRPSIFFIQETKFMRKGLYKAQDYKIFGNIRPTGGGSILTGIHQNLNPILISDGHEDNIEILVVEGRIQERNCRFINAYGPQEFADLDKRIQFYARLEEEIIKAKMQNSMICLELDANAKLGGEIIFNDPHKRSPNGELLLGIIVRNNLVVCNATALCEGLLTRTRKTVNGLETSIIDFLIVCEELFQHMDAMKVDDENEYPIESCTKNGKNVKVTRTDHNMLIGTFKLKVNEKVLEERKEIFKYNDDEGQKRFMELTSKNTLTKCFDEEKDILKASSKWLKELNNILHRSFKKVRISNKQSKRSIVIEKIKTKQKVKHELDTLTSGLKSKNVEANYINIKKKHDLEDKLERVENEIADFNAAKHAATIKEHFAEISSEDGEFSSLKMWRLKKKLFQNNSEVPTAMVDHCGNLISGKSSLKDLYKTTYQDRLSSKPIKQGWELIENMKNELFIERIELSSAIKSEPWTLDKIKNTCKKLKRRKARDRDDLIFELFRPELAGNDLMTSMTKMFNEIKRTLKIPPFLQKVTITSLYKNKGLKNNFANQRGVFNVSKVRSILDKVLYEDVYTTIDEELSQSNIGGRKGRNIRDHLFIIYGILNDVSNGSSPAVDIQSIDIKKCFDEMWYQDTHNDLYDVKIRDDKFALIAKLDETANVVVKTPFGPTDEFSLEKLVMQGSVFGPIKATTQIDTLGRDCKDFNQGIFLYKNVLSILPLSFIDDCLGFSQCGAQTVELNAIMNSKIVSKKLRLSEDKCTHMHFSKSSSKCYTNLKADNAEMKKSKECSYLGDVLSTNGSIEATIEQRRQKGVGICSQITGIVNGLSLGNFYFQIGFFLRETMLLNGILTNSEAWYPVNDSMLDILQNIDLLLLKKLTNGHSKTAKEAFYLETGLLPLRFVVMKKRLMYLHTILRRADTEVTKQVYNVQKVIHTKDDWYGLVMSNREELKIAHTDNEITKMSKEVFRTLVKKSVEKRALDYLNSIAMTHSKSKDLIKNQFKRETYFEDSNFSKSEIELLFALRTRTVRNIKENFPSQFKGNLDCELCYSHADSQQNLLVCSELRKRINIPNDVQYSDIFQSSEKQLKIVRIMKQLLRTREILLQ